MPEVVLTDPAEPNKSLALVTPPDPGQVLLFGDEKSLIYMSFDPKSEKGRAILDKCDVAPDGRVMAQANVELLLTDVYAHQVPLVDANTGEEFMGTRICLILADGRVLACVSEGIRQSVRRLSLQHGLPPWRTPIPVVMQLQTTKAGRNWPVLMNAVKPSPAKGAK